MSKYGNGYSDQNNDYSRDFAITLNLGEDLEKKYKNFDEMVDGKDEEKVVNIRTRQLAIAKILVKIHGRPSQLLIKAEASLGEAYLKYNCPDQSYDHLRMAFDMNKEYSQTEEGQAHQIEILKLLAQNRLSAKKGKEALDYLNEAEEICKADPDNYGDNCIEYAEIKELKVVYYLEEKNEDEALTCCEEVEHIFKEKLGTESERFANTLLQMGKIYENRMEYKLAVNCIESAIMSFDENEEIEGKLPKLIDLFHRLLTILSKFGTHKGKFDEEGEEVQENSQMSENNPEDEEEIVKKKLDCYRRLKELNIDLYGEKHKESLKIMRKLFLALSKKKLLEEALELGETIEEIEAEKFGPNSNKVAKTLELKAVLIFRSGDKALANDTLKKAKHIYEYLNDKASVKRIAQKMEKLKG